MTNLEFAAVVFTKWLLQSDFSTCVFAESVFGKPDCSKPKMHWQPLSTQWLQPKLKSHVPSSKWPKTQNLHLCLTTWNQKCDSRHHQTQHLNIDWPPNIYLYTHFKTTAWGPGGVGWGGAWRVGWGGVEWGGVGGLGWGGWLAVWSRVLSDGTSMLFLWAWFCVSCKHACICFFVCACIALFLLNRESLFICRCSKHLFLKISTDDNR